MSFNDIFKNSVVDELNTSVSITKVVTVLVVSVAIGVFIYLVYRLYNRSGFYSKDFNVTLALLSVITSGIVLALQSSLVISLGMVGALSIVRFRNAIKEPLDLFFLFWSIGVGIICGAGLFRIAIILSLVVTVLLFILKLMPISKANVLLVINCKGDIYSELEKKIKEQTIKYVIKTKTISTSGWDLIAEIKTKNEAELLKCCMGIEGVVSATVLSHDGAARF